MVCVCKNLITWVVGSKIKCLLPPPGIFFWNSPKKRCCFFFHKSKLRVIQDEYKKKNLIKQNTLYLGRTDFWKLLLNPGIEVLRQKFEKARSGKQDKRSLILITWSRYLNG